LEDISLYDEEISSSRPLLPETSPLGNGRVNAIRTAPGSSRVLFQTRTRQGPRWLRIDLNEKIPEPEDLSALLPPEPGEIAWALEEPDRLFLFREGSLDRLELGDSSIDPAIAVGLRGWGIISARELVLLYDSGILQRVRHDGELLEILLGDPGKGRSIFGETGLFSIHPLEGDLFLFLGEGGELIINRLPHRLAERGVRGFQWDRQRERLLVWAPKRLGIVDLSPPRKNNRFFEEGPSLTWVFETGQQIEQACWVHRGSHILFRDRGQICLLEVETFEDPALGWSLDNALYRLVEAASNSPLFYSEASGKIYYLDPRQRWLISTTVVPAEEGGR
jgi:hypothetical protein